MLISQMSSVKRKRNIVKSIIKNIMLILETTSLKREMNLIEDIMLKLHLSGVKRKMNMKINVELLESRSSNK